MSQPHNELELFTTVVDQSSFSAAARTFGITRSAACRGIERLEQRLGVRLLDRTTRRLNMTDAGEVLYQSAIKILSDTREAERAARAFQQEPRGVLRIASPVMIGLHVIVPQLPVFLRQYKDLSVNLTLSDDSDPTALEFDVIIGFGRQPDSSMISQKLTETRRIICASPNYIEEHGTPEVPSDLLRHNCLLLSGLGLTSNEWVFRGQVGPQVIKVTGNFVINTGDGHYEALIAGLGVGRATDLRVRADVMAGRLVELLQDFEPAEATPIYALYASRRNTAPKIRSFVNFLRERLAEGSAAPPTGVRSRRSDRGDGKKGSG